MNAMMIYLRTLRDEWMLATLIANVQPMLEQTPQTGLKLLPTPSNREQHHKRERWRAHRS